MGESGVFFKQISKIFEQDHLLGVIKILIENDF